LWWLLSRFDGLDGSKDGFCQWDGGFWVVRVGNSSKQKNVCNIIFFFGAGKA
jgi:hypothetical protein